MSKRLAGAGAVLCAALLVLAARPGQGTRLRTAARTDVPVVVLQPLASQLSSITAITHAGDGRLFVTLQLGQIAIWDGSRILPTPFLDVSALISCCGERGLLSTAFHPRYAQNGLFFVDYTDSEGNTVIARYRVSSDPNVADPFSGVVLLTITQPFANHNGGQLQFGPDGFLYIGMGDGGSANDPFCNGQSDQTLLGKLLRIDVDSTGALSCGTQGAPAQYGIPASNPFATSLTACREIWADGLRNPWRFSFDRTTGDLFIGDVGQDAREEIDVQAAASAGGQNYGWKIMEGTLCGAGATAGCAFPVASCGDSSYTPPVLEYTHEDGNCSVTGGYMYRGLAIPDLRGMYIYGDYCSGHIWAAAQASGTWSPALLSIQVPQLTTFGEDASGELYIGTGDGTLFLIQSGVVSPPTIDSVTPAAGYTRGGEPVTITGTNFTGQTQVSFGSLAASITVEAPTTLIAVVPAHPPGLVDVTVSNPGLPPATKAAAFAYVAVPRADFHGTTRVVTRPTPATP